MDQKDPELTWFQRLGMAFRLVFNSAFAAEVNAALRAAKQPAPTPEVQPPEKVHASALFLLGALQREGRLVDFLRQDVAAFSDEEVGAAARVVHTGCRKVLNQYFELQPATQQEENSPMALPIGFDAQRFRLTGNVVGSPPFRGTLKHHGWVVRDVRLPEISQAVDPRVLAPAEVEI